MKKNQKSVETIYVQVDGKNIPLNDVKIVDLSRLIEHYNNRIVRKKGFIFADEQKVNKFEREITHLQGVVNNKINVHAKLSESLDSSKSQLKNLEMVKALLESKLYEANGVEGGIFTGKALEETPAFSAKDIRENLPQLTLEEVRGA